MKMFFDNLTIGLLYLNTLLDNTLRLNENVDNSSVSTVLPQPAAGQGLAWAADGQSIVNVY